MYLNGFLYLTEATLCWVQDVSDFKNPILALALTNQTYDKLGLHVWLHSKDIIVNIMINDNLK